MSAEENKSLVRRFVQEFWNTGKLSASDELMATDATIHQPEVDNVAGFKAFNTMFRNAFPDWHSTAEVLIAEGDLVAER